MFERITFDQKIMGGRACLRGMRIPVSVIVGQIAHGVSFKVTARGDKLTPNLAFRVLI